MELSELKSIASKATFTADDRKALKAAAAAAGVAVPQNTKCANCWQDVALQLIALQTKEEKSEGGYLLDGVDLIVNGHRINNATIVTEEDFEFAKKIGTPKQYFK